ncbi:MAG: tetratricopeptide repeat protein [Acidobacteriota bacterium]
MFKLTSSVHFVIFLAASAIPAAAQPGESFSPNVPSMVSPREAAEAERSALFPRAFDLTAKPVAPAEKGSISVEELRNPLEGKSLKLILSAQDLLAKGEKARAMKVLQVAMDDKRAAPYALMILGTEHLKTGDTVAAIAELEESVRLLPSAAAMHSNLALALGWSGNGEQALRHATKALQLDPSRPKTRFVMGQILLLLGRKDEAEFHLKIAAAALPGARALLVKYFPGR